MILLAFAPSTYTGATVLHEIRAKGLASKDADSVDYVERCSRHSSEFFELSRVLLRPLLVPSILSTIVGSEDSSSNSSEMQL